MYFFFIKYELPKGLTSNPTPAKQGICIIMPFYTFHQRYHSLSPNKPDWYLGLKHYSLC